MNAEVIAITKDIKANRIKPIYFLYGDEPYYIDKLTEFIENNILTEDERGFNQTVFYGKDATVEEIVSTAKRYPMMAERQVVIVKEAQHLSNYLDKFVSYIENPQLSTVLVFAYKNSTLDKRKKFGKIIEKGNYKFESKTVYESKVGAWITLLLKGQGYQIEPKAVQLLVEFLGNDLSRISNELDKLKSVLGEIKNITSKDIEDNIGISKDYNAFELNNALGKKDFLKAYQIIKYFSDNQKGSTNLVNVIAQVHRYFMQIMQYHASSDKSQGKLASLLGVSPYFVSDYVDAAKNYPMKKVSSILASIREFDLKAKGVNKANTSDHDIMKEMLITILA